MYKTELGYLQKPLSGMSKILNCFLIIFLKQINC